jgi:hypothetical protein
MSTETLERPKRMYRIRPGFAPHFDRDGTERAVGVPFESSDDLVKAYTDKFELVTGKANLNAAKQELHPCGEDITAEHPVLVDLLKAVTDQEIQFFKKARRYRILLGGDIQDTEPSNIVNAKMLAKAAKNLKEELARTNDLGTSDDSGETDEE